MPDLTDLEVQAYTNVMAMEDLIDELVNGFRRLKERDAAEGAPNDDGALGGTLGVIEEAVSVKQMRLLLTLAVRRLADREASHG